MSRFWSALHLAFEQKQRFCSFEVALSAPTSMVDASLPTGILVRTSICFFMPAGPQVSSTSWPPPCTSRLARCIPPSHPISTAAWRLGMLHCEFVQTHRLSTAWRLTKPPFIYWHEDSCAKICQFKSITVWQVAAEIFHDCAEPLSQCPIVGSIGQS